MSESAENSARFCRNEHSKGGADEPKTCPNAPKGSPVAQTQLSLFDDYEEEDKAEQPHKIEITEVIDNNEDGKIDLSDVEYLLQNDKNVLTPLEGDGDFRSPECVALLDEADIVITNPPFSLFRKYVAQLMEHDKKFVIIGSQNAITYKEVFPLLKEDRVWLGYKSGDMAFTVPDYYEPRETRFWVDENGQKWRSLGNICWFTNLDIKKRHENLILCEKYDPKKYPKYDNYDAIEVGKVADIPLDYEEGYLVPIEYKQRLIDAGFDLSSDRMDENGTPLYGVVCLAKQKGTTKPETITPSDLTPAPVRLHEENAAVAAHQACVLYLGTLSHKNSSALTP